MTAEVAAATGVGVVALMLVVWLISLVMRDASIVDIVWGLGFVLIAWIVWSQRGPDPRLLLSAVLTTIWGLRLSGYLAWRNLGKGEDSRYVAMRRRYGSRFWLVSLFLVFGLQGVLMWTVSLPVQAASGQLFGLFDVVGICLWIAGLTFETVGDYQLVRFKGDPANKDKVLDTGLWRYTRHPNYFGDFMVWWGLYLIALAGGAWWTAIGPLVMTALLIRYSGAGLLEKTIGQRRPGYAEYVQKTNGFFPGPPR